jgi:hypothetical protein
MGLPRLLAFAGLSILLAACSQPRETWTVTKRTDVYASERDGEEKVLFSLAEGETCTPIGERMEKVYVHTEIQCKAGQGWVVDQGNLTKTAAK